jgi:tRNA(fMet)-specific endonuclease VapC
MILLDTNHVTVLRYPENSQCSRLSTRMQAAQDAGESFRIPVICVEEQMRGWLAEIGRIKDFADQIPVYDNLAGLFRFFAQWDIVPIDLNAAHIFHRLRKARRRSGAMDLKIAAIAIGLNALLLTADSSDFRDIPDLRIENWLV